MDENYNGESLNATGWASGTNDRTKQRGNFTSNYVYVVPVVYIQKLGKVVPNKPSPRLFRTSPPEEPVRVTIFNENAQIFKDLCLKLLQDRIAIVSSGSLTVSKCLSPKRNVIRPQRTKKVRTNT